MKKKIANYSALLFVLVYSVGCGVLAGSYVPSILAISVERGPIAMAFSIIFLAMSFGLLLAFDGFAVYAFHKMANQGVKRL